MNFVEKTQRHLLHASEAYQPWVLAPVVPLALWAANSLARWIDMPRAMLLIPICAVVGSLLSQRSYLWALAFAGVAAITFLASAGLFPTHKLLYAMSMPDELRFRVFRNLLVFYVMGSASLMSFLRAFARPIDVEAGPRT